MTTTSASAIRRVSPSTFLPNPEKSSMLNDGIDTQLNRMLVAWHRWSAGFQDGRGYPSVTAICRSAKDCRQYDDEDDLLDDAIDSGEIDALDSAIDQVPQPHRTALAFQARNLSSGAAVWASPRLPHSVEERAVLLMEARNMLMRLLAARGILS